MATRVVSQPARAIRRNDDRLGRETAAPRDPGLRRAIPGLFGLDLASLVPAWAFQTVLAFIDLSLRGASLDGGVFGVLLGLAGLGLVELLRMAAYLVMAVVLVSAVLSWVSPHAPAAPVFHGLAEPFLRPFRRLLPTIANVDLSPLLFLLLLQIVLMVLGEMRGGFTPPSPRCCSAGERFVAAPARRAQARYMTCPSTRV